MDSILNNLIIELKRGTQIIAVLKCLNKPKYGYILLNELQENGFSIEAGTLYPLLRRLEEQGLLSAEWDVSDVRPRKFYSLNENGKEILTQLIKEWNESKNNIDKIINKE